MESVAISGNIIPFNPVTAISSRTAGTVKKQESFENGLQNAVKGTFFYLGELERRDATD